MPATAGRVRMPANNRVHSSAALQTHGIWQSAIGYDPYAPTIKEDGKKAAPSNNAVSAAEPDGENAYASFQGLLQLARITNSTTTDESRGVCKKCKRVGHLTFQCRNFLSIKDELNEDVGDEDVIRELGLKKLKGEKVKFGKKKDAAVESGESSEEDEESDSTDSEYDSEIERIIAVKNGKKGSGKAKLSSSKKEEDEEREKRKKRGRSKKRKSSSRKRESSDSEDEDGGRRRHKKRKEKRSRRRDDDSSDDEEEQRRKRKSRKEKRRRRSHRHCSDDSEDSSEDSAERRHKRRSRRVASPSDSGVSGSDDFRVGRNKKRDEKNSRKRHREREN